MNKETPLVSERITIIRPANMNRIFNDALYDVLSTTDAEGGKLVILSPKTPLSASNNVTEQIAKKL